MIVFGTVDGAIVTMSTKDRELNSYQLFDIDMTCLSIFKHTVVAGGVRDFTIFITISSVSNFFSEYSMIRLIRNYP